MATGRALSIQRNEERKRRQREQNPLVRPLPQNTGLPPLNAAQMGGASGVGFEDEATQAIISKETQKTTEGGRPKSSAGGGSSTMSAADANFALRGAGLAGLVNPNQFAGLDRNEAARRIQEAKDMRMGQTTNQTSFRFTPEAVTGTKKSIDRLNFQLTDINRDPYSSKGTKQDKARSALEASAREIANFYTSPDELRQAMMYDMRLAETLDGFIRAGGKLSDIESKIPTDNDITNGMVQSGQLPANQMENQPQTTTDYLTNLRNPQANKQAEERAMNELIPERDLYQQEIARQSRIADEYKSLYFGTEEQTGLLKQKMQQALEEKRIIEEKEKDDKASTRAKARLAIEKNKAEFQIEKNKIEENRLAAKNYMTGFLAKLGALNTTGAAIEALQTLDTKYQIRTSELETAYKFDNRAIEIKLDESLNTIETDTDTEILKLQEDLTKDYETVSKEIMKLEQAAEKESFRLMEKYASTLRSRTTFHTAELKREAEKYAREYAKKASNGIDLFTLAQTVDGSMTRASKKNAITSSYTTVKNDIKKNLPAKIATQIITELTDEQMAIFLEDYLNERVSRQASFNPTSYFERWKKENDIKQEEDEDGFTPVFNEEEE